jgi:hypothetical protein
VKYAALSEDSIEVICSKVKRYIEVINIQNNNLHDILLPSIKKTLSKNRSSSHKQVNILKPKQLHANTHVYLKEKK